MQVVCRANTGESLSSRVLGKTAYAKTEFGIEVGRTCAVYGICVFRGVLNYLVIGWEGGYPSWFPAELFSVTDHSLPSEWYFTYLDSEQGLDAIWGYRELVLDSEHFAGLEEQDPKAVDIFADRCLRKPPEE